MKKYFYVIVLLTCFSFSVLAQTPPQRCASFTMLQQELQNDPAFLQQYMQDTAAISASMNQYPYETIGDRSVVTIPVVVHVIYNTTAQNISDAQVISQITALNKDYQSWNSDTTSLPAIYHSVHGNPKVAFCLAHTSPTGAYTTGIEHIHTNTTSFTDTDGDKVKNPTYGAAAWDRNNYLNIWVCNLGGGLLGYSTFPGGNAAKDGCVILYTAFGTIGNLLSAYDLGRTVTHEVGHWFALYHIWGDDGTSCSGSDLISDTPNQADENYGCPSGTNSSCSNSGDMSMNYMDYTDDACMYMFTKGQATKINSVLNTSRLSIKSSTKCNTPSDIPVNELYILFGISPNPTTGIINLYAEYPSYKNLTVEVYNVTGQQVYSNHFYMGGVDVQTIDLSAMNNGMYLVKVSDGKNNLTKQIILQK